MATLMRFLYLSFKILMVAVVMLAEWACSQKRAEQSITADSALAQVAAPVAPAATRSPKQLTDSLVQAIDGQLKTFKASNETEVPGESLEGGTAVGYFEGAAMRKADCWLYGETAKMHVEGYFEADSLRFVRVSRFVYDKPFYEEGFKVVNQVVWKHYYHNASQLKPFAEDLMVFQADKDTPSVFWVDKMQKIKGFIKP